jgi:hypothetical protein
MNEPLPTDDRTPAQKAEDLADLHMSNMKLAQKAKWAAEKTRTQVEALTPELRAIVVARMNAATATMLADCARIIQERSEGLK